MAVIISLASAPVAFADGPIVTSAKQAAQQLATAEAPRVNASAASAAAVQVDSGMSGRTKLWIGLALAGVLAVSMKAMDNKIQGRHAVVGAHAHRRRWRGLPRL